MTKRTKILIVEENKKISKIYQRLFDESGIHADFVDDKTQCLEILKNEKDTRKNYDWIVFENKEPEYQKQILEISTDQKFHHVLESSVFDSRQEDKRQISKETFELIEKPFSMVKLISKINLKSMDN